MRVLAAISGCGAVVGLAFFFVLATMFVEIVIRGGRP